MPFCPQCGVDNPANARFCDQCGAALIPVTPASTVPTSAMPPAPVAPPPAAAAPAVPVTGGAVTCPQCGASAIPGEAFCDNCGAPLNAPARPAAVAPAPPYNAGVPPQPAYPPPQPASYAPPPQYTPPPVAPAPPAAQPYVPPAAPVAPPRSALAPARLIVAASGVALPLPASAQAVVGRGDPVSNFFPEIDLGPHGALDNGVGRRHLRLFVQGGQVMLEDLDSTNGTILNGQKLAARQPQPLRDGDQIIAGKLLLRYQQ
jgi:hypothetical protein